MKRVTINYTRQTAETPWYWQISPPTTLNSMHSFIHNHADEIQMNAFVTGNEHTVTFTINNEEIYTEFQALVDADLKSEYVQYCNDNNINIDVVTEDI